MFFSSILLTDRVLREYWDWQRIISNQKHGESMGLDRRSEHSMSDHNTLVAYDGSIEPFSSFLCRVWCRKHSFAAAAALLCIVVSWWGWLLYNTPYTILRRQWKSLYYHQHAGSNTKPWPPYHQNGNRWWIVDWGSVSVRNTRRHHWFDFDPWK